MKSVMIALLGLFAFCLIATPAFAGGGFAVVQAQPQFVQVQAAGCNAAAAQQVVVQRVQPQQVVVQNVRRHRQVVVQQVQPQQVVVQQQPIVVQQAAPRVQVNTRRFGLFGLRRSQTVVVQ